ncbi:MAG: hypothetical protein L3K03_09685 [Thermoplasmata archaeon]|nr:hypothetical protein [Thermoplasmata archaeon]
MSLNVYLRNPVKKPVTAGSGIFVRENGSTKEITRDEWESKFPGMEPVTFTSDEEETNEVYSANITHNLNRMADEAGIYQHLWRPDEIGITNARGLVTPLAAGLALLESDPVRFRKFDASNGWGRYENLVEFVRDYLEACRRYPDAEVIVWR